MFIIPHRLLALISSPQIQSSKFYLGIRITDDIQFILQKNKNAESFIETNIQNFFGLFR